MSYDHTMIRLGSTAIAAVLALSSTPAFAQGSDTAGAPVAITPPAAPAVASAPSVAPVEAQTPVATTDTASPTASATVTSLSPAPVATQSTPVVHVTDDSTDASDDLAARSTPKAAVRRVAAKAEATPKAAEPAPSSIYRTPPNTAAPVAAVAPTPIAQPAPALPKATTPSQVGQGNEDGMLMIAGAGGFGILLLAGGGYALMRRKRREGEDHISYAHEPERAATAEPIAIVPAAVTRTSAPVTSMPAAVTGKPLTEGFDISHYGRHAQAAFRGPTPDNPSLSLKTRLKRAAFFDRRERTATEAGAMPQPVMAKVEQPQMVTRPAPTEQVVYRPQRLTRTSFRPVFSTSRT